MPAAVTGSILLCYIELYYSYILMYATRAVSPQMPKYTRAVKKRSETRHLVGGFLFSRRGSQPFFCPPLPPLFIIHHRRARTAILSGNTCAEHIERSRTRTVATSSHSLLRGRRLNSGLRRCVAKRLCVVEKRERQNLCHRYYFPRARAPM